MEPTSNPHHNLIHPVLCEGTVDTDGLSDGSDIEYEECEGAPMPAPLPNLPSRHEQFRHNNTPHGFDDADRGDDDGDDDEEDGSSRGLSFLPDRVRLLLDRFAGTWNGTECSVPPPASKSLIESLPDLLVDDALADCNRSRGDSECAICKIQMESGQSVKVLPCSHCFHSRCIVTWLHIHASCPLCRRRLPFQGGTGNGNGVSHNVNGSIPLQTPLPESHENRLRDLRRRRRQRQSLRVRTPQSRGSVNGVNGDRELAATELIHAVCEILDRYQMQQNKNSNGRSVRFDVRNNRNEFGAKSPLSPRPPPPRSSRSNTQIMSASSFPQIMDNALCRPISGSAHSSPSPKGYRYGQSVEDENEEDLVDDEVTERIISATTIKQDFAKWMKRRNRVSQSDLDEVDEVMMMNQDRNRMENCNLRWHQNENQNGSSMSMEGDRDRDRDHHRRGDLDRHRHPSSPSSPSPNAKDNKLPPMMVPFGTEWSGMSGQSVVERVGPLSPRSLFSGRCSPNEYPVEMEQSEHKGFDSLENARLSPFDLAISRSNTPTPRRPAKSKSSLHAVFSLMTNDELEAARNRHQSKMDQQQYIMTQIVAEQERRASMSMTASLKWKCPECKGQHRAFVLMPCRHLGLCAQCDAKKKRNGKGSGLCPVCNLRVQHKIAINFTE